jgi:transposase-like protein
MSTKQHSVPKDLKIQILERVKTSGKTIKEIASEHGISSVTIYAWLKEGVAGFTSREVLKLEKENKELKQIIGELTVQLGTSQKKWSL